MKNLEAENLKMKQLINEREGNSKDNSELAVSSDKNKQPQTIDKEIDMSLCTGKGEKRNIEIFFFAIKIIIFIHKIYK